MAEPKKKKNIFQQMVDALTNRDEKEAEEAAKKAAVEAAAAKAKAEIEAARVKEGIEKSRQEIEQARAKAEEAKKEAEAKAEAEAARLKEEMEALRQEAAAATEAAKAALEAQTIKHVWTKEDTYAGLAQHYYGSFKEPYWRLIYEHNKAIIGDHPNAIRVGLEIEIPPLPDELKK